MKGIEIKVFSYSVDHPDNLEDAVERWLEHKNINIIHQMPISYR